MRNFFDMLGETVNEWEIPILVMLSLASQLSLALFGSWRKTLKGKLPIVLLWFTCIVVADWAGSAALAALLTAIAGDPDTYREVAIWAAYILLHLGGADTITASSLEDNEWLRQIPVFLIHFGVVVCILTIAWDLVEPKFSILTLLLVFNGVFKFLDKIWSLTDSSFKFFIDSFRKQFPGDKILLKSIATEIRKKYLHESCYLYMMFASLFLNEVVPCETWYQSRELVRIEEAGAIKLVKTELGFMYDVFYTKTRMFCSRLGILIRAVNFISLVTIFVILITVGPPRPTTIGFTFYPDGPFSYIPGYATILLSLMVGAILVEVCSFVILSTLDWPKLWCILQNDCPDASSSDQKSTINKGMSLISDFLFSCLKAPFKACCSLLFSLHNRKSWPQCIGQHDLISDCRKQADPRKCLTYRKLLRYFHEDVQKHLITSLKPMKDDFLLECFYKDIKQKSEKLWSGTKVSVSDILVLRGAGALEKNKNNLSENHFDWAVTSIEYDTSFLIWHVATHICYNIDITSRNISRKREISKRLSDYMLYLLLLYPSLLPTGCGETRYKVLSEDVISYFKRPSSGAQAGENMFTKMLNYEGSEDERKRGKVEGYESLLVKGCRLAKDLHSLENEEKWDMVSDVWIEMLEYAASHSGWREHVQQLRRGAELLTFVRLLMTNFGLTEQLQRSTSNPN